MKGPKSYLKKSFSRDLPENIKESLNKIYETTWWRHSNYKMGAGDIDCNWIHVAVPRDLEFSPSYAFVYPNGTRDFKRSNTLRIPPMSPRETIKVERHTPQDISVICSSLDKNELNDTIKKIRYLYFKVVGHYDPSGSDIKRKIVIQNPRYKLNIPVVPGENGAIAEELENILRPVQNDIIEEGSEKFNSFYKLVKEKLGERTSLNNVSMQEMMKGGLAEAITDFVFND